MVRYISLILFIGLAWGQSDVDPLEAARRAYAAAVKAQAEAEAATEAAISAAAKKAAAQARSNAKKAKEDERARKLAEAEAAEEAELDAIAKAAGDEARRKIAEELGLDYEKDIVLKTAVIYLRNGERIDGDIFEIGAIDQYIMVRTDTLEHWTIERRIRYRDINYILHNNNGLTDYLQAAGKEPEPKPEPVIWSNSPDEILSAGLTFLQNNNLIDAEKYFYQALKIDSTFIPAIIGLAKVMIQYNDPVKANEFLIQAVQADEDYRASFDMLYSQFPDFDWSLVDSPPPIPSGPKVVFIPYDLAPRAKTAIRPIYPENAQYAGIEGVVVVQAFIDERGRVKETLILKGVPNTGLDEAAMEAIRRTKFKPAKANGKKLGVWVSIPINFRLK